MEATKIPIGVRARARANGRSGPLQSGPLQSVPLTSPRAVEPVQAHAQSMIHEFQTKIPSLWDLLYETSSEKFGVNLFEHVDFHVSTIISRLRVQLRGSGVNKREAATLLAEALLLKSVVDVHRLNYGSACLASRESSLLADDLGLPDLQASAFCCEAFSYYCRGKSHLRFSTYRKALSLFDKCSPMINSRFFLGLSEVEASLGISGHHDHYRYGLEVMSLEEADPAFSFSRFNFPAYSARYLLAVEKYDQALIELDTSEIGVAQMSSLSLPGEIADICECQSVLAELLVICDPDAGIDAVISLAHKARALGSSLYVSQCWDLFEYLSSLGKRDKRLAELHGFLLNCQI